MAHIFLLTLCISFVFLQYHKCFCTTTVIEEKTSLVSPVTPSIAENNTGLSNTTVNTTTTAATTTTERPLSTTHDYWYIEYCPDNVPCQNLGASCISCKLNHYCVYGKIYTVQCTVKSNISCLGDRTFQRPYYCRYGYQLDPDLYFCNSALMPNNCQMKRAPPETYTAHCQVKEDILCLGNRTFQKKFPCNWTSGFKWSTALALSITLGGFGVDRFYIGLWRSGIGKLFSFGGLGVWTIVDVILIAVGYVVPHDGSLYIYPWS